MSGICPSCKGEGRGFMYGDPCSKCNGSGEATDSANTRPTMSSAKVHLLVERNDKAELVKGAAMKLNPEQSQKVADALIDPPEPNAELRLLVVNARINEALSQLKAAQEHFSRLHASAVAKEPDAPGNEFFQGYRLASRYMSKVQSALMGVGWDVQVAEQVAREAYEQEKE